MISSAMFTRPLRPYMLNVSGTFEIRPFTERKEKKIKRYQNIYLHLVGNNLLCTHVTSIFQYKVITDIRSCQIHFKCCEFITNSPHLCRTNIVLLPFISSSIPFTLSECLFLVTQPHHQTPCCSEIPVA